MFFYLLLDLVTVPTGTGMRFHLDSKTYAFTVDCHFSLYILYVVYYQCYFVTTVALIRAWHESIFWLYLSHFTAPHS